MKSPNADGLGQTSIVATTEPATIFLTSSPKPEVTYTASSLFTEIAVGPSPTGIFLAGSLAPLPNTVTLSDR